MSKQRCIGCRKKRKTKKSLCAACRQPNSVKEIIQFN